MNKKYRNHHTINVFLDKDGYVAYFKEFPNISASGDTEEEAIKELGIAFSLVKKDSPNSEDFTLVPQLNK